MIQIDLSSTEQFHSVLYRTSGRDDPRDVHLGIYTVRYAPSSPHAPVILATADLQGREPSSANRLAGELLVDEIAVLQEMGEVPHIDVCLLCGDFFDYPDLRKVGGTGDVTSVLNAFGTLADTYAVQGNHDHVRLDALAENVRVLDGETVDTSSIHLGGVSGIIGDSKRNQRKSEGDFMKALRQCSTSRVDILMLHQGPEGAGESQRGVQGINEALRSRGNLLVLFGHCHWGAPFHREGSNLFCNVDQRVMLFLPDASSPVA